MKEKEFKHILKKMEEEDKINFEVYYTLDEKGNVVVDTDSMRDEFEQKLNDIWELTNEETDELTELVEEKIDNDKNK